MFFTFSLNDSYQSEIIKLTIFSLQTAGSPKSFVKNSETPKTRILKRFYAQSTHGTLIFPDSNTEEIFEQNQSENVDRDAVCQTIKKLKIFLCPLPNFSDPD
jgi:hypothetical protein